MYLAYASAKLYESNRNVTENKKITKEKLVFRIDLLRRSSIQFQERSKCHPRDRHLKIDFLWMYVAEEEMKSCGFLSFD